MQAASAGTPVHDFVQPEGVVEKEICDASGLLATDNCPRVRSEVFIQGTEPTRPDDAYQPIALDASTNLLWTAGCQGPRITRVFRIYPPDAQDWAKKKGLPLAPELDCFGRTTLRLRSNTSAAQGGLDRGLLTDQDGQSSAVSGQALAIVSPAENSIYQTSPQLPANLQQVEVAARVESSQMASAQSRLKQVTLFIDNVPIGNFTSVPYRALWQLSVGDHQARAVGVTTDGQMLESQTVTFHVQNQ
jgi:hypothetical protein